MAAKRAIHIVAISGSLRAASANTGLLRACAARLPEATTMEIIVPNLPLFNQDTETELNTHPDIVSFREKVKAADAILFACPEYNFSMSSAMKNAIDWGSRGPLGNVFNDKAAAIIGGGGGAGSLRAQEHLRGSACFLNLHVLNFPIFQVRLFDAPHPVDFTTGDVIDDKVKEQAAAVTAALADWARRLVK